MAERLNEQARRLGFACTYTARQISLAHVFGSTVTTLRIAARFDSDPGFRSELASALRRAASGFERIFVPNMLGLQSSGQELAQFERELGCSVCELPTLPPSVSGLRLFYRLRRYLRQTGVEFFEGFPVKKVQIHDGGCTELQIESPGHPMNLRGECFLLAAGRASISLLGGEFAGLDEQMRPITSDGSVIAWNLFVAKLSAHEGSESCGDIIETLAGYRAGNLAVATREHYAAG
jgi:hypothetical protein